MIKGIDDIDQAENDRKEAQRRALLEEENHYAALARVFGTTDGLDVAEWLLELSGYWARVLPNDRAFGKFELGRFVFDQLCLADINIVHTILDRRRKRVEDIRLKEKRAIEKGRM